MSWGTLTTWPIFLGHAPCQSNGWARMSEAHQPPLYYVLAAVAAMPADLEDPTGALNPNSDFIWAGQGGNDVNIGFHTSAETFPFQGQALALHLARGVSVLMGMITVALTIAIGWEIFPDRRVIGLMGAAMVAFNPQFLFVSGAINNDNLLVTAATGAWWQLLRAIKRPEQSRQWVWVGLWIAVGASSQSRACLSLALWPGLCCWPAPSGDGLSSCSFAALWR